jgi:flagella basal body P-ring formation protein FlgA
MRRFLTALAFVAIASPAFAGPVTLKADIADPDGQVTLGELFDGAGSAGGVVVANRQGPTVVLDAAALQAFAARSGLYWSNPQGLRRIVVRSGVTASAAPTTPRGNVEVLVYARSLSAGEIVQPTDLIWAKAAAAPADAPGDSDAVIGMAAKRPLREGAVVSLRDVSAPIVIKAGESVNVTWSDGSMTLKLQAKAQGSAAVGDSFNVINPVSKKIIEAVASGPGEAVVGPEAQWLKAARPAQVASR